MATWIRSAWLVGAYWDSDQTDLFLTLGIWQNGYADRFLEEVRRVQPGDLIAIKAAYTRKKGLPFENHEADVSVMAIKATGIVTRNPGDGRHLKVEWTPVEPRREWYFHTYRETIHRIEPEVGSPPYQPKAALLRFTFDGDPQDIDLFIRHSNLGQRQ